MKNRITKSEIRTFIKHKLATDRNWACIALLRIYDKQTAAEQQMHITNQDNGVGFTGVDAFILSSFAEQYTKKKFLSPKQMVIVHKKMPKYWKQIMSISNTVSLENMVAKDKLGKKLNIL